jgi:hypothetical protein
MKIFVDVDNGTFLVSAGFNGERKQFNFKRGDSGQLDVAFLSNQVEEDLGGAAVVKFALKEVGKYDAGFVVYLDSWTKVGGVYVGKPNFNTTQLNTLLGHGDADADNDVTSVPLMMEVSWSVDGVDWLSTKTVVATVGNDVIKGDEGVPVDANPVYPTSQEVVDAIADVAELQARFDAEPYDESKDYRAGELVYFTAKVWRALESIAVGESPTTDPAKWFAQGSDKVAIVDIVNNLTAGGVDKVLSAEQGKSLKELIDQINALLASDDVSLDEVQELVDYIKNNRGDIDSLGIAGVGGLQAALDAKQRILTEGEFVDGDKTKLDNIEAGATGDQDLSSYSTATGVEDNADVTDTANVESAGALMDSEVTNLADVKAFDTTDYEPAKGADDNFVTDAEKTVIGNTSGTNTGDQDLTAAPVSTAQQTALSSKLPKESINGFKVATTVGTTPATYEITDSDLGFLIQSDFAGETYYVLENTTVDGIVHIKAAATGNSRIYLDGSSTQYKDQFGNSVDDVDIPAGGMHSFIRANGLWSVLNASDPSKAPIDSTVNLTGDQTIAGEKTFTGQQELTGQTAATDDSAMTKGLIDDLEIYQPKTIATGSVAVGESADVVSVGFKDNGLQAPGNDAAARVCYLDIVSYYPAGGAGIARYARYILSGRYINGGIFESNTLEVFNVGDAESATISAPGKTVSGQSTVDVTITPPASGAGTGRSYIIKITPITTPVSW